MYIVMGGVYMEVGNGVKKLIIHVGVCGDYRSNHAQEI